MPATFQMAIWIQVPPILNPGLGPLSTIHLKTKKSPVTYNPPENENLLEWQIQLMRKQKTNTDTK